MRINNVLHRVKHKQGERTGKPLMSNNKGSSFVLVICCFDYDFDSNTYGYDDRTG